MIMKYVIYVTNLADCNSSGLQCIYLDIQQYPLSSIMCNLSVSEVLQGWESHTCVVIRNFKLKEEYTVNLLIFALD